MYSMFPGRGSLVLLNNVVYDHAKSLIALVDYDCVQFATITGTSFMIKFINTVGPP